jgi:hypothetical protein
MGFLDWFRAKRNIDEHVTKLASVTLSFTPEEAAVINRNRKEWAKAATEHSQGGAIWMAPKAKDAIDAIGLFGYVHELRTRMYDYGVSKQQRDQLAHKAINTLAKCCSLHDLPYYLYAWAQVTFFFGELSDARRLYALFLKQQTESNPDAIDQAVITYLKSNYHVDNDPVREAMDIVSNPNVRPERG